MGAAQRIGLSTHLVAGHWLTVMDCAHCGEVFAIPSAVVEVRRCDENAVYCPHGHLMFFSITDSWQQRALKEAERRAEEAERQAEIARQGRVWAEEQARGANIAAGKAKAQMRRLEERVGKGVCPCCHRTFKQLAAHMTTKHPDFGASPRATDVEGAQ